MLQKESEVAVVGVSHALEKGVVDAALGLGYGLLVGVSVAAFGGMTCNSTDDPEGVVVDASQGCQREGYEFVPCEGGRDCVNPSFHL